MSVPIIALKTSARNYAALVILGNRVHASLTGNGSFTTPVPALTVLQSNITDVETALAVWGPKGNRGTHADLVDLRNKAVTLHATLKSLAAYSESTASQTAGNDYPAMAAIIATSGFELRNAKTPQGRLQMPQNFHQFASRELANNQVKLKWKKPLNTTSAGNVKSYKVYRGTTNVFSAATILDTVTITSLIDTNNTAAPVTWTYWVVANNNSGDSVETASVTVTVVNV